MVVTKQLRVLIFALLCMVSSIGYSQTSRETIRFNSDWKFALGHASDVHKDFNFNTGHFSYLAKTGYGDGAASEKFDDRSWRTVQIPHDWCVGLPFDAKGSNSHGSKAIGKYFPEHSVGWYRKSFFVPLSDTARRIRIEFEGVYRNSLVFVNGFFVGNEPSGYTSFSYDITEYLNFGGSNTIAVRVDATEEEGWFYEGAGIYRNVWLVKTNPIHFYSNYPTFVQTLSIDRTGNGTRASIGVECMVINELGTNVEAKVSCTILNSQKQIIDSISESHSIVPRQKSYATISSSSKLHIPNPQLWSVESPTLYTLVTTIEVNGTVVDSQEIPFGVRTIQMTADNGLFINNVPVKIKGVCVHQDHAGVGIAIPYELQKWRIQQLKSFGVNAIRTSHNPPSPDLLKICDELGMLVMDELRLMGINEYHKSHITRLILRDRNHPSVFMWSLGNEEWAIEGSTKGAAIAEHMQNYAKLFDKTRPFTIASSGGWDTGIGTKTEVMGYNYLKHGNVDEHHRKFPWQPSIGTEESNTVRTRGIYQTIDTLCWLAPTNLYDDGMEGGWKFYAERDFLAGLFYWTGFDYRGEPTPYGWPGVVSQFGILDLCGFPKDNVYYLKSWWTKEPVVHIESNWNRTPGETFNLTVFSNCARVELVLNGKSIGTKAMEKNGHISWPITFETGTLTVRGYGSLVLSGVDSTKLMTTKDFKTAGKPAAIKLVSHTKSLAADGVDVALCEVQIVDNKGIVVPDANIAVQFDIKGNGKYIGVGNGNPSSHEPEVFEDKIEVLPITIRKELPVQSLSKRPEVAVGFDDSGWRAVYSAEPMQWDEYRDTLLVVRGDFELPTISKDMIVTLYAKNIVANQVIYVNGAMLTPNDKHEYVLPQAILKQGINVYAVVGKKLKRPNQWDYPNRDPGVVQIITPVKQWQRNTFNGLAQLIVQSTNKPGTITIQASAPGLQKAELIIESK